jgi:SAM-dependent methyltransferase
MDIGETADSKAEQSAVPATAAVRGPVDAGWQRHRSLIDCSDPLDSRRESMSALSETAVEAWDKRWATAEGCADWLDPEPDVVALLPELEARSARRVLDLGCGVGRHALLFAAHGFAVEAIDGSAAGVATLRETARSRGLALGVRQAEIDPLPFADASFDFVLSWNVIYHGTLGDAGRRLAEIWRVLKPGGLYQGTMLPTRNINYGKGRTSAPGTFVVDGAEERGHPHFYCDAATLVALFAGFELVSLQQRQHRQPGSWHWHVLAERRPQ